MKELREQHNVWSLEEKVAFLSRPEAYPDVAGRVEAKQTHRSWIFLTATHAWKLKKPVRTEYLDFSTPDARRRDCVKEVRLNRRLARDVYRGVVPLTADGQPQASRPSPGAPARWLSRRPLPEGEGLQLNGSGQPVDWLVCMRRLPSDRMLDEVIARRAVDEEDVLRLASLLAGFYKRSVPVRIAGPEYRRRLAAHLESARNELLKPEYRLPSNVVEDTGFELEFLRQNQALFDNRVQAGKIIDAHGDLRPEHICLEPCQPVIIDCLEFNRNLRILDAVSEITFLALECERLGAPNIGRLILNKYSEETGDRPSEKLLAFYKSYHACVRAKIAVWHLKDNGIRDRDTRITKATDYLSVVSTVTKAA